MPPKRSIWVLLGFTQKAGVYASRAELDEALRDVAECDVVEKREFHSQERADQYFSQHQEYEVEAILDCELAEDGLELVYKVHWKGYGTVGYHCGHHCASVPPLY